jgi:hypothetical protein
MRLRLLGEDFEKLTIYKFSIDYPSACRTEFNPKNKHNSGDLVFHFPNKEKVFITWGELEKAKKKFPTLSDYAENSIKQVRKEATVFEREKQSSISLNSHEALYNQTSVSQPPLGLLGLGRKPVKRGTYSVHLYCEPSARFFVIYALFSGSTDESFRETFMHMAKSFTCH